MLGRQSANRPLNLVMARSGVSEIPGELPVFGRAGGSGRQVHATLFGRNLDETPAPSGLAGVAA